MNKLSNQDSRIRSTNHHSINNNNNNNNSHDSSTNINPLQIINIENEIKEDKNWLERIGSILIFIIVLISYVTQSELSQIIQNQSDYQKPYLLLYLTHSSYLFILPLHLLIIKLIKLGRQTSLSNIITHSILDDLIQLKSIFIDQYRFEDLNYQTTYNHQTNHSLDLDDGDLDLDELENDDGNDELQQEIRRKNRLKNLSNLDQIIKSLKSSLPLRRFLIRSIQLTFLIAFPSLSWFLSVALTSDLTSVTAIYNTNTFFVILICLISRFETISIKKIISVLISLFGVLIITFSNPISNTNTHAIIDQHNIHDDHHSSSQSTSVPTTHRLLGTTLAFVGSLTYAGYEVWYKKVISLPDSAILKQSLTSLSSKTTISNSPQVERHSRDQEESTGLLSLSESQAERSKHELDLVNRLLTVTPHDILLHANSITSAIGFFTLTLLWIPIPFLHFSKLEPFELPPDTKVTFLILGMISMGVIFNAGFMVLLGLWGPVVASVGNLCTLVLVAISDLILIPNYHLSFSVSIGCILISTAFIVLVIDLFQK